MIKRTLIRVDKVDNAMKNMVRFLNALWGHLTGKRLALSHEDDVDGIVSAALYLVKYPDAVVVLANPQEIRDKPTCWFNWFTWSYVADLPCPRKAKLLVDHHKTNNPRAEKSFHDPTAVSAASLAIKALSLTNNPIAEDLVKLANDSDSGKYQYEETLLLNDAIKGADYKGRIWLARALARHGLRVLGDSKLKPWIARNRDRRRKMLKIADQLKPSPVTILAFQRDIDISYRSLCLELERRGAKKFCAILAPLKRGWRLYLGASRDSPYDCSILAVSLGGGGHKFAAGAQVRTMEEAINAIKKFLATKTLKVVLVRPDIKTEEKFF